MPCSRYSFEFFNEEEIGNQEIVTLAFFLVVKDRAFMRNE